MSESSQIVIRFDRLPQAERARIADEVLDWLIARDLVVASTATVEEREQLGYAPWSPGPAWQTAVTEPDADIHGIGHNGVEVSGALGVHSAMGNSEDPRCGRCGAEYPLQDHWDVIDGWVHDDVEPTLTCDACGWSALLGDWPCEYPMAVVGAPAVTFHGWPLLRPEFIEQLVAVLGGGRWRLIHASL